MLYNLLFYARLFQENCVGTALERSHTKKFKILCERPQRIRDDIGFARNIWVWTVNYLSLICLLFNCLASFSGAYHRRLAGRRFSFFFFEFSKIDATVARNGSTWFEQVLSFL